MAYMMTLDPDRSEAARCLAKCIAFQKCGKPETAEQWAKALMNHLGYAHLLLPVEGAL